MSETKPILVPWDFSEKAENALEHAVRFSEHLKNPIKFVHVIKKQKEMDEAREKMTALEKSTKEKFGVEPTSVIVEGSIFKVISEVADEIDASLVIMGTHGIRGMQKFTGSWALKVITGTKAPFVVVQDAPGKNFLKNIVFPIDFKLENKEKLIWAHFLNQISGATVHLCQQQSSDQRIKQKIHSNFLVSKKYLTEKEIDYVIKSFDSSGDFGEQTIEYAKEINAELILIMTTKNISFQDYVLGASEQQIIANDASIPVMCINPRNDLRKFSGFGNS